MAGPKKTGYVLSSQMSQSSISLALMGGCTGRMYCQRRPGEEFLERNVQKKVKHGGGSLMVWGCLTQHGTGWLHRVNGHLNAVQYCKILTKSFLLTLHDHNLKVSDIVFQQDYDAQTWFKDHGVKVLPCVTLGGLSITT